MGDLGQVYWTVPEIQLAVYEGMEVWGAETSYWRTRGTFPISPTAPSPFYDLSVLLPTLRSRAWTLDQMVKDIQFMLLEAANGISGAGMSGQTTVATILDCIQSARDKFVLDARLPLSLHSILASPPPPDGMVTFPQTSVFVHRAAWQDIPSSTWTNLWRDDTWAADKSDPLWTLEPGDPRVYSEAENAPLKLQIIPPPVNAGLVEALTVDSLQIDMTSPASTFNVPDEWVHAIKYAALAQLLSAQSMIQDMQRAEYCEKRYQQAVEFVKDARSVIRLLLNNVPLPLDSLAAIDAGNPFWRNTNGTPYMAGSLFDIVVPIPGIPDTAYSISADVVQSAPLPQLGVPDPDNPLGCYIQMGQEELNALTEYVKHILSFKCGGNDFKSTMSGYDSFMLAVSMRKGVNRAKIRYLSPLFGVSQKELAERPDRMMTPNA